MITAIDQHTALVLIDLQKGIVRMNTAHPVEGVLEKASELIKAFRAANLPIVIVNVNPVGAAWQKSRKESTGVAGITMSEDFTEIVESIGAQPGDIYVTKQTWNAFYNTALDEELKTRGITNIVLGGVATSIGVEGTARAASERAYNISFATDAMTDGNADAHAHSIGRIFPRIGELGTTAEIIEKLSSRS